MGGPGLGFAADAEFGGPLDAAYADDADDAAYADGASSSAYLPISLGVLKGGAPSTMDYGRMWVGEDRSILGESAPTKRRSVGLTLPMGDDRAYCIVPCCRADSSAPFILRIQADVPFSLKQASPRRLLLSLGLASHLPLAPRSLGLPLASRSLGRPLPSRASRRSPRAWACCRAASTRPTRAGRARARRGRSIRSTGSRCGRRRRAPRSRACG